MVVPGRNALKSIMSGVLGSFVSRNNDVDGYWGIGILCLKAAKLEVSSISFDLNVSAASVGSTDSVLAAMAKCYGHMLQTLAEKGGFSVDSLQRATLAIEFGTSSRLKTSFPATRGKPFVCSLTVVDSQGRLLSVSLTSWCEPHNPSKEHRSSRSDA
jgi:hypothetical protein